MKERDQLPQLDRLQRESRQSAAVPSQATPVGQSDNQGEMANTTMPTVSDEPRLLVLNDDENEKANGPVKEFVNNLKEAFGEGARLHLRSTQSHGLWPLHGTRRP